MKTQPPGAPTTAADVADVYLRALSELTRAVVEQGDMTRASVDACTEHVLALSGRLDALIAATEKEKAAVRARLTRIERELGITV